MTEEELVALEKSIGVLPRDYRQFLANYPASFAQPVLPDAPPLSDRIPGSIDRLRELNQAPWTSPWRSAGYIVIGTNGVGDPYLVAHNGKPGAFIGDHEVAGAKTMFLEDTFEKFIVSVEAEWLDSRRDLAIERNAMAEALELADAAAEVWKRYGRDKRATRSRQALTSLRKLTSPKTAEKELRSLLSKDPPAAATALRFASNVDPLLIEEILEAKMFERERANAYMSIWRALPKERLVPWMLERSAKRTSPDELFWLDWGLQKAGVARAQRDALFGSLPEVPAALRDGEAAIRFIDIPVESQVAYPVGDDAPSSENGAIKVHFARRFQMTPTLVTEEQFRPFRAAFAHPKAFHRPLGPREPAQVGLLEAFAFTRWLEVKGKLEGVRLPTDDEWEVAARAGFWWPDGRLPKDAAEVIWSGLPWNTPIDVARKKPNPWGLYDVLGVSWEWTASEHSWKRSERPDPLDPAAVPTIPSYAPNAQALCGGTLPNPELSMHTPAFRHVLDPTASAGFRLVRATPR